MKILLINVYTYHLYLYLQTLRLLLFYVPGAMEALGRIYLALMEKRRNVMKYLIKETMLELRRIMEEFGNQTMERIFLD